MLGDSTRRSGPDRIVAWIRDYAVYVSFIALAAVALATVAVIFGLKLTQGKTDGADLAAAPSTSAGRTGSPSQSPGPSATPTPTGAPSAGPPGPVTNGPPPSAKGFPDATNTGVPPGTALTAYSGSCTITTNNRVIDAKILNCDVSIRATGVVIKRSKINGSVNTNEGTSYSFRLEDSEVDAGLVQGAAVGTTNMTVLRSDIHGGVTSIYCYSNCTIQNSYLHGQRLAPGVDWHLGTFLANDNGNDPGGRTNAHLVHNTLVCDAQPNSADGGCSGNVNLFGDFGPITSVTVDNNYFGANTGLSYCVYGGSSTSKPYQPDHVVIINNVFQRGSNRKCGAYGPVTGFDTRRLGNVWSNNVWDDQSPVPPEL
ncbi:MAG: hypothetical protein ACM30G_22350 [Micromonosporaceae bacterium]